MTNPLQQLSQAGQSIWLDYMHRKLMESGELKRLIEEDAVTGMTSNPSIFEKAIGEGGDYDDRIKAALADADLSAMGIYERLAIKDIQDAADQLKPVWDRTKGVDGYVSLEVLALPGHGHRRHHPAEAERLWKAAVDPAEPDDQGAGHKARRSGDRRPDRPGDQRQRHPAVRPGRLSGGGRGPPGGPGISQVPGRGRLQGARRGQLLRQPHRHPDRQGDRPPGEGRRLPDRKAQGAARQGGDRQRQDRLPALPRDAADASLAGPGRGRRLAPTAALGLHGHQGPGLFRRALCRDPDRARHRQHHADQDAGGLQGPRQGEPVPGRGCRGRAGCAGGAQGTAGASTSTGSPRSWSRTG